MRSVKVRRCVWGGAQLIVGVAVGMIGGRETVRFAACSVAKVLVLVLY